MSLTTNQIKAIAKLNASESIRDIEKRLDMEQESLRRHIRNAESKLGFKISERNQGRNARHLTSGGETIVRYCRSIAATSDKIDGIARDYALGFAHA